MFWKNLFNRQPPPAESPKPRAKTPGGSDGQTVLRGDQISATDPSDDGRFASVVPDPGVRLWVGGELVEESAVVTAADEIRYELQDQPDSFFRLELAADRMAATVVVVADPYHVPDTVTLVGNHPTHVRPTCSPQARKRAGDPRERVLAALTAAGVTYGVDEAALDRELAAPSGRPVVVATGQQPRPYKPGWWTSHVDAIGLIEPGVTVGIFQGEETALPRITLDGRTEAVYSMPAKLQRYRAGKGTRMIAGGKVVASASGRVRVVPVSDGHQVEVVPVYLVEGDLTEDLDTTLDVVIRGDAREVRVKSTGDIAVLGSVDRSELQALNILVAGTVNLSQLAALERGHFAPVRPDLTVMKKRLELMRETLLNEKAVRPETLQDNVMLAQELRRRITEMNITRPEYRQAVGAIGAVVGSGTSGVTLSGIETALQHTEALLEVAEQTARAGSVRVGEVLHSTIWSGREIIIGGAVNGGTLYCAGNVTTPPDAKVTKTEITAGGDVKLGIVVPLGGSQAVRIRSAGFEAEEVQPGCVYQAGVDQREFKRDLLRVSMGLGSNGLIGVRQS